MAARPLPKLPLISDDDDMSYFSMRCDYDKVDYTKMRHLHNMEETTGEQNDSAQRQIKESNTNCLNPSYLSVIAQYQFVTYQGERKSQLTIPKQNTYLHQ